MWAEIKDDSIFRLYPRRPKWYSDSGEELSDSELAAHLVYRVIDVIPELNDITHGFTRNPKENWEIDHTDHVVRVTYTVFERPLEESKQRALRKAASTAEQYKVGGTQMPGHEWIIPSDDKSTNRLFAYKTLLESGDMQMIRFCTSTGEWIDLDLSLANTMISEVSTLLAEAAAWEEDKHTEIHDASSIDDLMNITYSDFRI